MAREPQQVLRFLRDLAARARPFAERELDELRRHARDALGLDALQPWDRAYVAEKLKHARHGIDDEALRPYFPLPRVLAGLFALVERLFGVQIVDAEAPVLAPGRAPPPRVARRRSRSAASTSTSTPGPASRAAPGWTRRARAGAGPAAGCSSPWAHLVCNFAAPVGGRPALLTHDDVITLFHEFGHGLHHLLTQVDELALSGISGVEWDAAELPSQFMENFAWEWAGAAAADGACRQRRAAAARAVRPPAGGTPLRQPACSCCARCEYALFDMRLHAEAGAGDHIGTLAREVEREISLSTRPACDRWPNSFPHVFDGGYAAGYYGYHWAEVLSADAFAAFEEAGMFDPATGARWRAAGAGDRRQPARAGELRRLPRPRAAASTRCCATKGWPESWFEPQRCAG